MQVQVKEAFQTPAKQGAALYVHVPFCVQRCDYCAFYREPPRRADMEAYLGALRREWALSGARGGAFETVFFGGGTPGVLTPEDFHAIGRWFESEGIRPKEWTVELSPATAHPARLQALKDIGVNRLSLGVQSFSDAFLKRLGRRCGREQILRAIGALHTAGFSNFNIDLMIALPGQTPEALLEDIEQAAAHDPAHISTYCLTFEDDAPLLGHLQKEGFSRNEQMERACYLAAWQRLPQLGYGHYEISNFAKPGRECIHNLNTWKMGQWLGLGPSAASQWQNKRWGNIADLSLWLKGVNNGTPPHVDEVELTNATLLADALIFGLRLTKGVDLENLKTRFGEENLNMYSSLWPRLEAEGLLTRKNSHIFLTTEGLMLVDAVGAEILEYV